MRLRSGSRTRYGLWAFLLGSLVALLLLIAAGLYTHWKKDCLSTLEAGSGLALLPEGIMEFSDRGDGPVVLVIHGSPGGYDQGIVYGAALRQRGFRILSISRPGYLRTPLETGVTIEEQADAIDSLLKLQGISCCAVLGISEGTPCALQLAKRHPERVTSMALLSPLTSSIGGPIGSIGYQIFHDLTGDLGCWYFWLLLNADPRSAFEQILGIGSSLRQSECASLAQEALTDPNQDAFLKGLGNSIIPISVREYGIINDNAQLKNIPPSPPGSITAPVLFVVGKEDIHSPIEDTHKLISKIPRGRLLLIPHLGHILPIGHEYGQVWDAIGNFLKSPDSE